ncbi:MAG: hypothetical protein B7Z60_09360 [Ferrovum sp. 37-45-19]|jgi:hypothetical protein|nr:MAG: hypothetical protein B7Z60_09360 [Ferrovum sp. 37-45-19]HQT82373.1 hypothetical protein [Ferrovaceae bacterium]HQU07254.1 hypothetical protein [Ferrovaceae bacterium]
MKTTNEIKHIPHTAKNARVTKTAYVKEVYAIVVENARYRNAVFSGVIELADASDSLRRYKGKFCANAKLEWFGKTLKKNNPFITLEGAVVSLMPSYSGPVIAGLGI